MVRAAELSIIGRVLVRPRLGVEGTVGAVGDVVDHDVIGVEEVLPPKKKEKFSFSSRLLNNIQDTRYKSKLGGWNSRKRYKCHQLEDDVCYTRCWRSTRRRISQRRRSRGSRSC